MGKFEKIPTKFDGVFIIQPRIFRDGRGFFLESYNKKEFQDIDFDMDFVQDNHSCSSKGVIRGMHYQTTFPQGKLVRVLRGSIFDVVIDIRNKSPTFCEWCGFDLAADTQRMIYIPPGFAHGFLSLEDHTEVQYKTTDFYHPEYDAGIWWNDPNLGIQWPLQKNGIESPILSEKDSALPLFDRFQSPFTYLE